MQNNDTNRPNIFLGFRDIQVMSADKFAPKEVSIMLQEQNNSSSAQDVRVVSSGIDTLYIGYDVNVNKEILSLLEEKKAEAKEKEGKFESVQVTLGDSTFTLRPVGVARYAYVLKNSDLTLWISSKNGMPYPNVYVCFR